jgi:hypothetical protein
VRAALALPRAVVAARDNASAVARVHAIVWVKPARGLISRPADQQVRPTGNDFAVAVRPYDFEAHIVVVIGHSGVP